MARTKPATGGVYVFRNIWNQKVYVGSSAYVSTRRDWHRRELNNGTHKNPHFRSAWNVYGSGAFTFDVLEIVHTPTRDLLTDREQYWIDTLKAADPAFGYNLAPIAYSCLGVKRSEETRRKMSEAQKGNTKGSGTKGIPCSEEKKQKIAEALRGRPLSEEHLQKLRAVGEARVGIPRPPFTDEHKRRISEAKKGRPAPNKGKPMSEEQKKKISEANKIKMKSDEVQAKLSKAQTERWRRERETRLSLSPTSDTSLTHGNAEPVIIAP